MKLNFLGRGSAFNTKEGNTSAYYKQEDMLLLIDCGESVFQKIKDSNLLDGVKDVNILITHLHSDHAGSLSSLVMYCYYCKGIKPNVYYPRYNDLVNFLETTGAIESVLWNYFDLEDFKDKTKIEINPFRTVHVKEISSFGYEIDDEPLDNGEYIIYTGDMCEPYENMQGHLNFADRIYIDTCMSDYEGNVHMSLKKLCKLIRPKYRNKVWCMHLDCDEIITKAKMEGFNVVEIKNN